MTLPKSETLADALCRAQSQMQAAKFDKQNPHFKNKYASLASVIDAIRKPLADNGLSVVQMVQMDRLITRLQHTSGQFLESAYPLPATPTPQQFGSALTYARRYSLSAICCISADEDDDAEITRDKVLPKKDSRDVYNKLQEELREQETFEELMAWGKMSEPRIAIMPEDWQDILKLQFEERRLEFKQKAWENRTKSTRKQDEFDKMLAQEPKE
jgi:hypothetical protein